MAHKVMPEPVESPVADSALRRQDVDHAAVAARKNWSAASVVLLLASFVLLFYPVLSTLVYHWSIDDNYSHGYLIVPLALYLAWERRHRLAALPIRGSWLGLVLVIGSVGVLIAGRLGAELFLTRVPIIGVAAGSVLFLLGWQHLRVLAFPILFLFLMIPIPSIIFNQIAFPLQLIASRFGELALQVASVPVLREGNVITLANTQLEVAEACSGIRSLISLLTLAIVFGYFMYASMPLRWILAFATVPVAIVANGLRVAGTGIAAHYYGREAAEGFFHTFSGWLVFLVALAMLYVVFRVLVFVWPSAIGSPTVSGRAGAA
jgi:exosortase A